MKLMKTNLNFSVLFVLILSLFLASCQQDLKKAQIKAIEKKEKQLYETPEFDRTQGFQLIDTYVSFSDQYTDDTLSAVYLYKAGEIAMNLMAGSQAILYFDKIISNYPTYSKTPECIFLKAFIFENQLNDLAKAEHFYNEFMAKYPTHILVKDAKASLEYLGKSPEELVKIFQEKNKETQN
jgi:tetratricopeptide (TPR) repeat protein